MPKPAKKIPSSPSLVCPAPSPKLPWSLRASVEDHIDFSEEFGPNKQLKESKKTLAAGSSIKFFCRTRSCRTDIFGDLQWAVHKLSLNLRVAFIYDDRTREIGLVRGRPSTHGSRDDRYEADFNVWSLMTPPP